MPITAKYNSKRHHSSGMGTEVVGTTIDFADWFRQFAITKKDYWKAAIVTNDGTRIEKRLQIGRKSSALHSQRFSFLIGELVEMEAKLQGWGLEGLSDQQRAILANWQESRSHLGLRKQIIVKVGPFHDDHVLLTLNTKSSQHILTKCRHFIQVTLQVELSPKPEANKPFAVHFSAIGASYDTTVESGIVMQPNEAIRHNLAMIIHEAR